MVFDDATLYQESALYTGEAIEKTAVSISTTEGDEMNLITDVMNFVSIDNKDKIPKAFMRFDGAKGGFTSKYVDTSKPVAVVPKLKTNPVNTQTGDRSFGDSTAIAANTIAGINFNYTQPFVDYNHEGLAGRADGDEVANANSDKWANAGTGGADYDIESNIGAPFCVDPATTDRSLSQKAVQFSEGDHMIVPSVKVDHEYTIYMVLSSHYTGTDPKTINPYFQTVYGDAVGQTLGPGGRFSEDGNAVKIGLSKTRFSFRHSGKKGEVATFDASAPIMQELLDNDFNPCHVFIVRRDRQNNIFVQDRSGKVIANISQVSGTPKNVSTLSSSAPQATDGPLLIERLGTTGDIATNDFNRGLIARFGVIKQDIGYNESVRLADDLFQFYSK